MRQNRLRPVSNDGLSFVPPLLYRASPALFALGKRNKN